MRKVKMTVSIAEDIAEYLRSTGGVSATIEAAVAEARARALEAELERAYRDGAEEARGLDAIWRAADAEVRD